ncbi:hypothetical protein BDZ91DRAFT_766283 [Kalaharituber pfeilii]|nr:hypothetical protein BDZ91DRAFT_766283 [Kalaharituber pfeilii]
MTELSLVGPVIAAVLHLFALLRWRLMDQSACILGLGSSFKPSLGAKPLHSFVQADIHPYPALTQAKKHGMTLPEAISFWVDPYLAGLQDNNHQDQFETYGNCQKKLAQGGGIYRTRDYRNIGHLY